MKKSLQGDNLIEYFIHSQQDCAVFKLTKGITARSTVQFTFIGTTQHEHEGEHLPVHFREASFQHNRHSFYESSNRFTGHTLLECARLWHVACEKELADTSKPLDSYPNTSSLLQVIIVVLGERHR